MLAGFSQEKVKIPNMVVNCARGGVAQSLRFSLSKYLTATLQHEKGRFMNKSFDRRVKKRFSPLLKAAPIAALAFGAAACATSQQQFGETFNYKTWDGYLGGGESSQYSSLDQINKDNVHKLEVAWEFEAGEDPPFAFGFRFSPTIVNGVMYVIADGDNLVALNGATGEEIWRTEFEGRIGQRGINYWENDEGGEGRLFLLNDGMLRAVDAKTGEIIEGFGPEGGIDLRDGLSREDRDEVRPLQHDNPGRVFEDTIIISLPAGNYDYDSAPADIHAYDVRTGERKWVFHVIPEKGEFGYDTWPETDHERFGGAHNWSASTIDTELGIIYIPTGSPRFDWYGGNREGDNLFGNSIIALDARTGKRIWHFQAVHHDLWDFDLPTSPKLLTIERDGENVPIVIQPTKMGYMFVFDRRTGEPIWDIEERPVPASDVPGEHASPTQPFPVWPEPYLERSFLSEDDINPYLPEQDKERMRELLRTVRTGPLFTPQSTDGLLMMPNQNGGSNWGMVSVDPEKNRLYIVVRQYPSLLRLIPNDDPEAMAKMPNSGDDDVQPYSAPFDYLIMSNGMTPIKPPWSTIVAYDMNTGEKLYDIPNGDMMPLAKQGITGTGAQTTRGGPVATGGGLLFVGTASDRKFRARDADTGEVLWEHDLPAASEGIPAVYEVDGRQYIVITSGWEGMFHQGLDMPPVPDTNRYMVFALPEEEIE